MDFSRTMVKTTIYSHDIQKDRFVIFNHEAAKMGEISRRDTFETTGVMLRSKILSPDQKCGNLTHFVALQNTIPGSGRTTVKKTESKFSAVGQPKWIKFVDFFLFLWNFLKFYPQFIQNSSSFPEYFLKIFTLKICLNIARKCYECTKDVLSIS